MKKYILSIAFLFLLGGSIFVIPPHKIEISVPQIKLETSQEKLSREYMRKLRTEKNCLAWGCEYVTPEK